MKSTLCLLFLCLSLVGFSQSHQQTIDSLFAINKFHEASIYIENAGLKKTPGYRYYYFEARRRSDLVRTYNGDIVFREVFPKNDGSNEYYLTLWTKQFQLEDIDMRLNIEFSDFLEVKQNESFMAEIHLLLAKANYDGFGSEYHWAKAHLDSCLLINPNLLDANRMMNLLTGDSVYLNKEKQLFPMNPNLSKEFKRKRIKESDIVNQYLWATKASPQESEFLDRYLWKISIKEAEKFLTKNYHGKSSNELYEIKATYALKKEIPWEEIDYSSRHLKEIEIRESRLMKDSANYSIMYYLIRPYFYQKGYDKAIFYAEKLDDADLSTNHSLLYLSKSYYQKGNYEKSLEIAEKTLSQNSESYGFFPILFDIYFMKGETEKAMSFLIQGLREDKLEGPFLKSKHIILLFNYLKKRNLEVEHRSNYFNKFSYGDCLRWYFDPMARKANRFHSNYKRKRLCHKQVKDTLAKYENLKIQYEKIDIEKLEFQIRSLLIMGNYQRAIHQIKEINDSLDLEFAFERYYFEAIQGLGNEEDLLSYCLGKINPVTSYSDTIYLYQAIEILLKNKEAEYAGLLLDDYNKSYDLRALMPLKYKEVLFQYLSGFEPREESFIEAIDALYKDPKTSVNELKLAEGYFKKKYGKKLTQASLRNALKKAKPQYRK